MGLLFYGYATGIFCSRKLERATYESVPFRFLAGNLHPDHDTIADFRKTFLPELKDLFVQVLLFAQEAGVLNLGNISLDGTKIHADASKSKAISYKHLLDLESQLRAEVEKLFALTEHAEQTEMPEGVVMPTKSPFATRGWRPGQGQSCLGSPSQGTLWRRAGCLRCQSPRARSKARQTGVQPAWSPAHATDPRPA